MLRRRRNTEPLNEVLPSSPSTICSHVQSVHMYYIYCWCVTTQTSHKSKKSKMWQTNNTITVTF